MENDLSAEGLNPLEARIAVLETAVATLARMGLAPEVQPFFLQAVEEAEKTFFMRGLPAGCLPLGATVLGLKLLTPPDPSTTE